MRTYTKSRKSRLFLSADMDKKINSKSDLNEFDDWVIEVSNLKEMHE